MDDREWLTPKQLATWLGVPLQTVYTWRYRRIGPKGHRVGKHVRFRRRDVEHWLEERADEARV